MEFWAVLIITFVSEVAVVNYYINVTTTTTKQNRDSNEVESLEEETSENKT